MAMPALQCVNTTNSCYPLPRAPLNPHIRAPLNPHILLIHMHPRGTHQRAAAEDDHATRVVVLRSECQRQNDEEQ